MPSRNIPKPGNMRGPCKGWCRHPECKDMKAVARTTCPYCRKTIGYATRFIQHGDHTVHALCHDDAVADGTPLFREPNGTN